MLIKIDDSTIINAREIVSVEKDEEYLTITMRAFNQYGFSLKFRGKERIEKIFETISNKAV